MRFFILYALGVDHHLDDFPFVHCPVTVWNTVKTYGPIEHATGFRGRYFVLLGRLSPLDGLGPKELGLDLLAARLAEGEVQELIVATNPTVEGEATATYLSGQLRRAGLKVTRIAMGIPVGSDIEYADEITMLKAMEGRREV